MDRATRWLSSIDGGPVIRVVVSCRVEMRIEGARKWGNDGKGEEWVEWLGEDPKVSRNQSDGKLKKDGRVRCYWVVKSTSVVRSSQPLVCALSCTVFARPCLAGNLLL